MIAPFRFVRVVLVECSSYYICNITKIFGLAFRDILIYEELCLNPILFLELPYCIVAEAINLLSFLEMNLSSHENLQGICQKLKKN